MDDRSAAGDMCLSFARTSSRAATAAITITCSPAATGRARITATSAGSLARMPAASTLTPLLRDYGAHPEQFGCLRLGHSPERRRTVIVIIHGGFWRARRTAAQCAPIAE